MLDPDTRRRLDEVLSLPKTPGIANLDAFEFADLAAVLGWDVEETVPVYAEAYGMYDEAARELLLGARSERLTLELRNEADERESAEPRTG